MKVILDDVQEVAEEYVKELEAENVRLREALGSIANHAGNSFDGILAMDFIARANAALQSRQDSTQEGSPSERKGCAHSPEKDDEDVKASRPLGATTRTIAPAGDPLVTEPACTGPGAPAWTCPVHTSHYNYPRLGYRCACPHCSPATEPPTPDRGAK